MEAHRYGLSINLFLAEGHWSGLVVADAPAQNAKLLSIPRTRLRELLGRDEIQHSGIYLLTGPDPDLDYGLRGYIGESDTLPARLQAHHRRKPFWSRAYVVVSKDGWFSKSHIRYLEARLLQEAHRAPLLTSISNDQQDLAYDRLSDGDTASLEAFVDCLRMIMPAIGCPLFSFPHATPTVATASVVEPPRPAGTMFELTRRPAHAVAYLKDGSFWVCAGSTARLEEMSSLRDGYRKARQTLQSKGILRLDGPRGVLVFIQDVPFKSASDAAAVVGTASLNGRKEWKVLGTRTSLSQWEAADSA